jgi:hypothetical protein
MKKKKNSFLRQKKHKEEAKHKNSLKIEAEEKRSFFFISHLF